MSPAATTLAEALEPLRSDPSHAAVLLDIDGTLAPIVTHVEDAHVPEATRALVIEIAERYGLVACVSGRRAQAARRIVAIGSIAYVGNHGGELMRPGSSRVELDPELEAWTERVRAFAKEAHAESEPRLRIRVEDKRAIAAFHWRGVPDEGAAEEAVRGIAARAQEEGLAVHWGRKVLEVRPPVPLDKGLGVTALLRGSLGGEGASAIRAAVYVGDDATDLDAFRGLRALAGAGELECVLCVAVGSEEAPVELAEEADLTIEGAGGVRSLLEALL
ncbi:MAG TPA: trehalose-phosphatase [Solirubrobacteraceae bacterium]|nr:trehalose-phosphatase [Solirubrobacteraceae bacterium]